MTRNARLLRIAGLLFVALPSAGCVSASGNKSIADDQLIAEVQEGVSTKENVRALFGRPADASFTSDGKEIWRYQYSQVKGRATNYIPVVGVLFGGVDTESASLTVLFDENGRVQSIVEGHQSGGGGGLQDVGR